MRLLEEELGVKLLTRTARGVIPTEGGLALLRASEKLFKPVAERAAGHNSVHVVVQVDGVNMIAGLIQRGVSLYLGPPTLLWEELTSRTFVGTPVKGLSFSASWCAGRTARKRRRRLEQPQSSGALQLYVAS